MAKYAVVDEFHVQADDGTLAEVGAAIKALHWVPQLCPVMPHEYAVLQQSPRTSWDVVDAMVSGRNPRTYRGYFRGYQRPNRYWDAPDGLRYWRTGMMLNRCRPESVELPERVDDGARASKDWDGPPWAPARIGIYEPDVKGHWWPAPGALASGYAPCKACSRRRRVALVREVAGTS